MLLSRFYQVHDVEPMLPVLSASMNRINHYANMSMQYAAIFKVAKNYDFLLKKKMTFFLFLLQNIDCGYMLEPPHGCGFKE